MKTLQQWQKCYKNKNNIIINASATDGSDSPQEFPIGMCFRYINYQGIDTQIGNHDKLIFCGIREYTDQNRRKELNRTTILKTLQSNGITNTILTSEDYFKTLPSYKFVVSPEGNGIDCHRHYEALMAGCIPIVEDNPHIRKLYGNCPILYTKDYSEITSEYLTQKYSEMIDKTYDFSKLFLSSYPVAVQYEIKRNSAHWTKIITKKSWGF
jgi:hypothetical protein